MGLEIGEGCLCKQGDFKVFASTIPTSFTYGSLITSIVEYLNRADVARFVWGVEDWATSFLALWPRPTNREAPLHR